LDDAIKLERLRDAQLDEYLKEPVEPCMHCGKEVAALDDEGFCAECEGFV
jgi:hypothetical protein